MKTIIMCKLCNQFLGDLHGNQVAMAYVLHFKTAHPKEFKALAKLREAFIKKRDKYKYQGYDKMLNI